MENACRIYKNLQSPPYIHVFHDIALEIVFHLPDGIGDRFPYFFRSSQFCDITLCAEDVEVNAHQVVLSASSEFFRQLLSGVQNRPQKRRTIDGVTGEALRISVEYIYYKEELDINERNATVRKSTKDLKI